MYASFSERLESAEQSAENPTSVLASNDYGGKGGGAR
jgi:hypothetical protein